MERLIWGMKSVAFSQLEFEKGHSHEFIKAVDMQGSGSSVEDFYAPCTCKVIGISSSAHTVFFVSCNSKGETCEVMCADGRIRVVTFALTHCDDISWITKNRVFTSGEKCYREGTYANGKKGSVGTHVHIECAEGEVGFKVSSKINGKTVVRFNLATSLNPSELFFALKDFNTIREDKLESVNKDRRVNIKWTDSRVCEANTMKVMMKAAKAPVVLRQSLSFNTSKKPNGPILNTMSIGERANVIEALPIQKDGYQWLRVEFKGQYGFMQYDSKCYEIEII